MGIPSVDEMGKNCSLREEQQSQISAGAVVAAEGRELPSVSQELLILRISLCVYRGAGIFGDLYAGADEGQSDRDHEDGPQILRPFSRAYRCGRKEAYDRLYYKAMVKLSECRKDGFEAGQSMELVRALFSEDVADRVNEDVSDIDNIMHRKFERVNCFDCEGCRIAGRECAYPAARDIVVRTIKAMKAENAPQEEILELLKEVY